LGIRANGGDPLLHGEIHFSFGCVQGQTLTLLLEFEAEVMLLKYRRPYIMYGSLFKFHESMLQK